MKMINEHFAQKHPLSVFKKGTLFRQPKTEMGKNYYELLGVSSSDNSVMVRGYLFPDMAWSKEASISFSQKMNCVSFTPSSMSEEEDKAEGEEEDEEDEDKAESEEEEDEEDKAEGEEEKEEEDKAEGEEEKEEDKAEGEEEKDDKKDSKEKEY